MSGEANSGSASGARRRSSAHPTAPTEVPEPRKVPTAPRATAAQFSTSTPTHTSEVVVTGGRIFPSDLVPGTMVGEYRIEGKIAEGGMGAVYAAAHPVIGKNVAVKVIRQELCASPAAAERFIQEARVVNKIGHPNIVDIFSFGTLEDGRHYYVMERLRGETLADRMVHGRISPLEAIEILLQICPALDAAHSQGVVHRDLKPENIFMASSGGETVVKLLDFGIAKLVDPEDQRQGLTNTGTMVGTAEYVSPEQARGRDVDHRADIYSLGAIAYELFLEGVPFSAESVADVVAMHLHSEPEPPSTLWPDIPFQLEVLLLRMLAKEAGDRPTLADVAQTLRAVAAELASRGKPAGKFGGRGRRRMAAGTAPQDLRASDVPELPPETARRDTFNAMDSGRFGAALPSLPPQAAISGRASDSFSFDADLDVAPRRRGTLAVLGIGGALAAGLVLVWAATRGAGDEPGRTEAPSARATPVAVAAPEEPASAPAADIDEPRAAAATVDPTVTVAIPDAPDGVRVRLDGETLDFDGDRAVGARPAGSYALVVDAPGYATHRERVEVEDGDVTVNIDMEPTRKPVRKRPPERRPESRNDPATTRRVPSRAQGTDDRGGAAGDKRAPTRDNSFDEEGTIDPFAPRK